MAIFNSYVSLPEGMFYSHGVLNKTKQTYTRHIWVGGLEHFLIFPIQLGMSSSQLTNSYFSEGWLNHEPDIHDCTV